MFIANVIHVAVYTLNNTIHWLINHVRVKQEKLDFYLFQTAMAADLPGKTQLQLYYHYNSYLYYKCIYQSGVLRCLYLPGDLKSRSNSVFTHKQITDCGLAISLYRVLWSSTRTCGIPPCIHELPPTPMTPNSEAFWSVWWVKRW